MTTRLLIAVFLIAQASDGAMTYAAVRHFGVLAEANPLVATWITLVGPQSAILGAKVLASGCGLVLYYCGMSRVLLALTLLYGAAAIVPWLTVFHQL